ncbi:MAG: red chlorophyll catabolite reductase [Gammaproteobacteria bacterium]|nr:red chlorophyll catabolite reductase [Gammaproteobacteria bacterium]
MSGITQSIEEMVEANPNVDNQENFDALWGLLGEMLDKVKERFDITMDPCSEKLQPYVGLPDTGAHGYIGAWSGDGIDWLIHSWTGNPKASFTNMHLTISLGPHIDVPHFGFALGTVPDIFWYMDYVPRCDMLTNPEYAEKYYYGEANQQFIDMDRNPAFTPFVSREFYTRLAQTPNSICVGAPFSPENIETVRTMAFRQLDRWFEWIDAAEPVADGERAALAERDELVRRTICERDPANVVVDNLFGEELGRYLVKTLWGGTRTLPRPA